MAGIVLEEGTGVAGATSWVVSTDVDTYATNRALTSVWLVAGTQVSKDAAILEAGLYLNNEMRFVYRGTRIVADGMPVPRTGLTMYRGPAIASNVVPGQFKQAQMILSIIAYGSPGSLQTPLGRGGAVKSEKVDVLSTEYFDHAPIETLIREVMGLLQPFLLTDSSAVPVPYKADPDDPVAFQSGVFGNPPTWPSTS